MLIRLSLADYASIEKLFYIHLLSAHPLTIYNDIHADIPQALLDKEYSAAGYANLNRGTYTKLGGERHLCNICRKPAIVECKYGGRCRRGRFCAFYHPTCQKVACPGPESGCSFEHPHQNRTCFKCSHLQMQSRPT
ncbi:hypothetical protein AAVH_02448 [Aphelenchoides avenae]|nr:hypothetical protein AAVH_02448 [Aphelenchus avenae]